MKSVHILRENILQLEKRQAEELSALKQQISITYESLKPINIIKDTLENAFTVPDIKNKLINTIVGLGTGFITKKILLKNSESTTGKLLGTVLQFVIANLISKNTDVIKNVGKDILQFGLNVIENQKQEDTQKEEEPTN